MFKISVQFLIAGLLTLPGLAAAAGSVKLPATSQAACFDANGTPRPCTGTGEDGEKRVGEGWPTVRFGDNNNGTVTDRLTGLIWSKHANAPSLALPGGQPNGCPNAETAMTWLQALDFVACLNTMTTANPNGHAGFTDWRLPNLNELESMVNPGVADTSAYLKESGFGLPGLPNSQVQAGRYWSSTSDASGLASQSADAAWDVDLVTGDFSDSTLKNDLELLPRGVWPVRGNTSTPAQIWQTGQTVCYDEVGEPRTCTGTGEDGEKQTGALWPTPRFKPNSDATLAIDRLTRLTWPTATQTPGPEACEDTGYALTWQQALDHVACLNTSNFLGHKDWRLPNRNELHSLADYSTGAPAFSAGHPFDDLAGDTYWTSTTDLSSPTDAWTVSMFDGSLSSAVKAEGVLHAWPVRGPDVTPSVSSATPNPGIYNISVNVELATSEKDSTIYYTTDGTPVSTNSPVYSAPITLSAATTTVTRNLQFFSVDSAGNVETTKSASYTLRVNDLIGSMKINAGAQLTYMSGVTLALDASASAGVSSMQFSNDGVSYSAPETYANTKSWVLNSGDGLKTVHVKYTDGLGVVYAPVTSSIILDTTAPTSTASPGAGNYAGAINAALTMNEAGVIYYTTDGTTPTASSSVYSGPISFKSPSTTTLRFFSRDKAGNDEAVQSLTYTMNTPDLSGAVDINSGAKFTDTRLVKLALIARSPAGVTDMQVACDGTTYAQVEPFAVTRSCTLSSGDGLKTVLVKFRDGLGNWNPPLNAQIILDTTAPATTVTPAPGTFSDKVTVTLKANEPATIYYTTDGSAPTTSSTVYAAPFELAASATTTFNVKYFAVDQGGLSEKVESAVFKVNVSNLTGSVRINNGESYAASPAVTLTLSAQDSVGVTRMQFSNDGKTYTPLEPYATSKAWTLDSGDGIKTVFVRFESGTGSLSTISANINYSATVPSVSNCDLNGDKKVDIGDALKALQMAIGLYSPTLDEMIRGDVAPLVNGKPKPDGKIDLADAMVILQRSLGLVATW